MPEATLPDQGEKPESVSTEADSGQVLADFSMESAPGNEIQVMQQVAQAVSSLGLSEDRLERLKTAVAEATMNAMEHGNHYRQDQPVHVQVRAWPQEISVEITDYGGGQPIPPADTPDLDAKLAGLQSPRGWGLFLIQKMVDQVKTRIDHQLHIVELIVNREGKKE